MTAGVRPEALAAHVAAACRRDGAARVLLLDVDGTLAPIAPRPELARIPRDVLLSLDRLAERGWRAALVTGRPAAEATRLAGGRALAVFGSHGLEAPGVPPLVSPEIHERLMTLAWRVERAAAGWGGVRVERKPAGIAVHDRELAAERLRAWRERLRETLEREDLSGLELLTGRHVLELRPSGASKGRVASLWDPVRVASPDDPTVVAAGDDRTDEELFEALGPGSTTVRVGPPGRITAARWRLPSPMAVGRFLESLGRLTKGGGA